MYNTPDRTCIMVKVDEKSILSKIAQAEAELETLRNTLAELKRCVSLEEKSLPQE